MLRPWFHATHPPKVPPSFSKIAMSPTVNSTDRSLPYGGQHQGPVSLKRMSMGSQGDADDTR